MKIGVLTDLRVANSAYRAPVGLATRGHQVELDGDGERAEHPKLFGCDVVHIYRYNGATTRRLREAGIGVV
jgi:hypothetical protein